MAGRVPPANVAPYVHHYIFTVYALTVYALTVYALDADLSFPSSTNFPANAETLYQALIEAGRCHHILASASLTGLYSTMPSR
ncbi:MAG TPA: hypothetical protein VHU83_10335 [Bryobacteraceae bacterium]|nr:hypothetical protein [Bryobacteraceae bacterium]